MKKDNDRSKSFTRRAFIIGALQTSMLGVLGGRLAWLQVVQGAKYKTLADNNRINLKMIAPSRGKIVDRFETPLAVNDQNFRAVIVPEQTRDMEKALSSLAKLIDLSQRDIGHVMKQAERQPAFVPIEVRDNLSWEDVAKIEVRLPELPGLSIDEGEIRTYPYGTATAHIVGYVGAVGPSEINGDPVLSLPGFKIGKTGIEKSYDEALRGTAGTAEVEVNVVGREVRELKRYPGEPGRKLRLTVDADLQIYVQQRLAREKSVSAVIMDVFSGAIYAMASSPSFDANLFTRGLSAEKWEEMLADPGLPLTNKAVGGQYPPGSTFKMVTALAALEEGKMTRNTTHFCPGYFDYGGDRFHCWKRGGHGTADLNKALAQSCDTFFYNLAVDVGIDKLAEYAIKMGIGQKLDFDLNEERPGLMPDKAWKMGHFGKPWQPGETIVAGIGQGYILTTPLQLATMISRLVNGGYAVKPWMVAYVGDKPGQDSTWPKIGVSKHNLDLIKKGTDSVVSSPHGTAHYAQIPDPAFHMGGKTGTAQVIGISMEDRSQGLDNADLPWKYRDHSLFVGYAPASAPRYACAVVLEHGGGGSAPIARDLLLKTQQRDPASTPLSPGGMAGIATPAHKPKMQNRKT